MVIEEVINDNETNDAEVQPKSILRDRRERMTFAKRTFVGSVSDRMTRPKGVFDMSVSE